jgi:hypothetical protein
MLCRSICQHLLQFFLLALVVLPTPLDLSDERFEVQFAFPKGLASAATHAAALACSCGSAVIGVRCYNAEIVHCPLRPREERLRLQQRLLR